MSSRPVSDRRRHSWLKSVALLAAIAVAIPLALAAQTRQLRLVSTAWPPFTNAPGQPRFASDLVDAALKRVSINVSTTIVDAGAFTTSLLGAEFDGSAAAWKDAERERALLFSQPYLQNRLILLARKGGDVTPTSLSRLVGKRVAVVEGYSYGDAVNAAAGPTFVRSRSEEDSLTQLLNGTVDYTLMDELVVDYIVRNHGDEARSRLQIGSAPLIVRSLYLAINRKLPDADSIINRFNAQLRGMVADRTYHSLLHLDWIQADVDGDGLIELVPLNDRAGTSAPLNAYNLISSETSTAPQPSTQRFFIGGSIYDGWLSVPERYKVPDPNKPDPSRSMANIFSFRW